MEKTKPVCLKDISEFSKQDSCGTAPRRAAQKQEGQRRMQRAPGSKTQIGNVKRKSVVFSVWVSVQEQLSSEVHLGRFGELWMLIDQKRYLIFLKTRK